MLSTQIATHRVIIKTADWKGVTKYPITQEQYINYRLAKADRQLGDTVKITDIEWNELREVDPIKLEEFEKIHRDKSLKQARWICWFWVRHPLSTVWKCECGKEFQVPSFLFSSRLEDMWFRFYYDRDITWEMRTKYKQKYLSNNK